MRRIRTRSLAKARNAIKPVSPQTYQAFLLDRQGVGPVGGERYEGIDGLMRVIEQLEGVSLAAQIWESSVFSTRVRGYHPSMLDELIASGDVIWVGEGAGDTAAKEVGNIAFYPADSPLVSETVASDTVEADEALTIPQAVITALQDGGAFHASQLSATAKSVWERHAEAQVDETTGEIIVPAWGESQFEEALWSLVWQGRVTNSSFAPVRALMQGSGIARAPRATLRRRVRMHTAVPMTLGGLWSAVAAPRPIENGTATSNGGMEEREIARIESLLDRYGVIAAPLIDKERIAGGFSRLYPVLKRMEEHGTLVRGLFVDGFGAAQFAGHDTVDALRSENQWHSQSCVALEVTDPASLTGAAIAWPELEPTKTEKADGSRGAKPARRTGSIVVFKQGEPVLFAVPKSHRIMAFTDDEGTLRQACSELVYALQRQSGGSISFNEMNGISLKQRNKYMRLLHAAGFTESPQGMKLYR